jgi:hypothetical protein
MLPLFSGINDVIQMRQIEKDATILTINDVSAILLGFG